MSLARNYFEITMSLSLETLTFDFFFKMCISNKRLYKYDFMK